MAVDGTSVGSDSALPDLSLNALEVAPLLLNCALCVRAPDGSVVRRAIAEVEAYHGFDDRASHAHRGMTPRNSVMFGPPGQWYVYLCYGVHWLLNLVTAAEGYPSAVLIRGVEGLRGPGRLTKGLTIDRRFNAQPCAQASGLWIEPLPADAQHCLLPVRSTPRIGVDYAGSEWSSMPWRFVRIDDSRC